MKKIFLSAICLLPFISSFAQLGIKVGYTSPQMGLHTGLMYAVKFKKEYLLYFQPEIIAQSRQEKINYEVEYFGKKGTVMGREPKFNLLIPLNLKGEFNLKSETFFPYIMAGAGPSLGFGEHGSRFDFPVFVTIGARIKRFTIDARYVNGFIDPRDFNDNKYLMASFGYFFSK
jgi:hypothetical protein